jgi:hypothetical protein
MKHGETRIYSVLEPFDQFASKYRFEPDFEPEASQFEALLNLALQKMKNA